MRILERLPDRFKVCYEGSCGYGHFHDLLHPVAARVLVSHPGQLRLIYANRDVFSVDVETNVEHDDLPKSGNVRTLTPSFHLIT